MNEVIETTASPLQLYDTETLALVKQAMDICNLPVVKEGYIISGRPAEMVFMNLQSMALSRVKKHMMNCNPKDPLCRRAIACVKLIVAECLQRKYEIRAMRGTYNHIRDIDIRTRDFFNRIFPDIQKKFAMLQTQQ